ncbi:MAG: 3-deoxy-7-phosphoheptulonate synthase [Candidatus Zophobacter franzmannii]|nr:3-deoxy-7-phosphoheptulonate synthase [Candidatus Zophobacter franzmannii]
MKSLNKIVERINGYGYDRFVVKGQEITPDGFTVIAGPCTIENRDDLEVIAKHLVTENISFIRGGAHKLRTSPNDFAGLGSTALDWLQEIGKKYNLVTVSEITDTEHLDEMIEKIDILLVGTRNMLNYPMLTKIGKTRKPVILKRGMSSTLEEWLLASEYILKEGNSKLIYCERGIRTFDSITRNTYDISAIPLLRSKVNFPVIGDPSHATGLRELIRPISIATASVGASGLLIEAHPTPETVLVDSRQTIDLQTLSTINEQSKAIIKLLN